MRDGSVVDRILAALGPADVGEYDGRAVAQLDQVRPRNAFRDELLGAEIDLERLPGEISGGSGSRYRESECPAGHFFGTLHRTAREEALAGALFVSWT